MSTAVSYDQAAQRRSLLSNAARNVGVHLRVVPDQPTVVEVPKPQQGVSRPKSARAMVGQEKARVQLLMHLESAKKRERQPGHVLLFGPPGLGKTSMAELVAAETGNRLVQATASALNTPLKMGRQLANLEDGDVLLIDEIHGLSRITSELLYTAMEDGRIEVSASSANQKAEMVSVDVAPFTLVGATTIPGRLTQPMRDRFALVLALTYYTDEELRDILVRAAEEQGIDATTEACQNLGRRSRGTPRVALNLLQKVLNYADTTGDGSVTENMVVEAMALEGIDSLGLTETDQMVLLALCDQFKGGPVGLENLSVAAGEDLETVRSVVEPFLIRRKLVARFPRGRVATKAGFEHLDMRPPADLGW